MKLNHRSTQDEIMDDLNISGEVIDQTLRELDVINSRLGGHTISLRIFKKILKKFPIKSVADLGCGGADILINMAKIAQKSSHKIRFSGIDANPHIVAYAKKHTADWSNILIERQNILDPEFANQSFDIIHCCLFLHHFSEQQLVALFAQFKTQATCAIVVNDLHRHFLAFYSIKILTLLFSKSYMVRNDAALSVARGFKKKELQNILHRAGINHYTLQWKWAFRWQLVVYSNHAHR